MKESYYSRIEERIETFPSLPTTVADVMRVVSNPDSSATELTQAVLPDQSMCVAILKIANSALYGRPKKVSSIETAIMVLGFNEIQNIVLSKAVLSSFADSFRRNDKIIDRFWDHSFTCALAARGIAEHFSIKQPGRFFIGGLIHDIGKLAMLLTFPDEYPLEKWMLGFSFSEKLDEEQETFGMTHGDVAGRLLRKWSFPDKLTEALELHHNPVKLPQNRSFALILQMADALSHICCQEKGEGENINLRKELFTLLPNIGQIWQDNNLPWEQFRVDMWYTWLEIERKHGSSILSILASR